MLENASSHQWVFVVHWLILLQKSWNRKQRSTPSSTRYCHFHSLLFSFTTNAASRDEIEDVYKRTVRENFTHFTKQTHIKCISSLLVQKQLISHDECKSLNEIGTSLTFYTEVLPKKGAGAYTLLRCCIREETEHRGHTCLNELFVEEYFFVFDSKTSATKLTSEQQTPTGGLKHSPTSLGAYLLPPCHNDSESCKMKG